MVGSMNNQYRDALLVAMKSLPDDQRQALVMKDVMDLDYPEISDLLEVSEDTARNIIAQARSYLANVVPTE